MLAFQRGDQAAFETLVRRHGRALINYFFFQCRREDVAEDCAQEVWVRIFRSGNDYVPRGSFRSFLYRVARNLWIDRYRSHARRPAEGSIHGEGEREEGEGRLPLEDRLPGRERDPGRAVLDRELAHEVAAAVGRLPEEMRDVFVLAEIEGLPYARIAEILDIPEGTVKSRMFNAVRKLRESLRGYRRLSGE